MRPLLALLLLVPALGAPEQLPARAEETRPLAVGARAPDAVLRTVEGADVRLDGILQGRLVALVFYRGGW